MSTPRKHRITYVPTAYAVAPVIVGLPALISYQEGHMIIAGILGVAFLALFIEAARRVRVFWR